MSHPLRLVGQMAGVHKPSAFPRLVGNEAIGKRLKL